MKAPRRAVLWWAGEAALAALFQFLPGLINAGAPSSDAGLLLYALLLYFFQPVLAAVLPFFAVYKGGVNPYAAFFPFGLALFVSPAYAGGAKTGAVCLALGLVSAAAGAELLKCRRKKTGAERKNQRK